MNPHAVARNARLEAKQLVGNQFDARVLEPSPPPVLDENYFADDPVATDDAVPDRRLVSPVANGDLTWQGWLHDQPAHAGWVARRWLGAYARLGEMPRTFAETRSALHRVAVYVVSPARRRVNGKIGLRWTLGGFGTPFFDGPEQVRVAGTDLVRQRGEHAIAEPLTTLGRAAAVALDGSPDAAWAEGFDVPALGNVDEDLGIDPASAAFLGDWYGFAWSILEELRADAASVEPSRVQLWPEHFDVAFDCVSAGQRRRVTLGASPGDATSDEPYLYVLPADFDDLAPSKLWDAQSFNGASLGLSDFVDETDQRAAALAFFCRRLAALDEA